MTTKQILDDLIKEFEQDLEGLKADFDLAIKGQNDVYNSDNISGQLSTCLYMLARIKSVREGLE